MSFGGPKLSIKQTATQNLTLRNSQEQTSMIKLVEVLPQVVKGLLFCETPAEGATQPGQNQP